MKTFHISFATIFLSLFLLAGCGENNQDGSISSPEEVAEDKADAPATADVSFVDGMTGKVFQNYLHLQRALYNSNSAEASTAAGNLAESFGEERAALKIHSESIAESDDIVNQRAAFYTLTEKIQPLLTEGIKEGEIYQQFCPMAFENTGAYWFSDTRDINNPYFGEMMPHCGKIQEVITAK